MNRVLIILCLLVVYAVAQAPAGVPAPRFGLADPPASEGAIAHRLSRGAGGLILSWLERGADGFELRFARLGTDGWGEPGVVTVQERMMANWADVPAVVQGGDGALYAHWLLPSTESSGWYDIHVLRSTDDGTTWAELGVLNDDGIEAEHGFVSYIPIGTGVRAYWLDGRATREEVAPGVHGPMSVRTARIGQSIEPSAPIDLRVCDCCSTDAAMTDAGPVVVYRGRTEDEVRDIWIAGGGGGEGPRLLHADGWEIAGCPVNGPVIDASGSTVVVAWYTAADQKALVLAAFSTDNGRTFTPPVVIDEQHGASVPQGRVDVVLDGDEAVVSWLAKQGLAGSLKLQRISAKGLVGAAVTVSPIDSGRLSGFAEMELLDGNAVVVWRDTDAKLLRAAAVPLEKIGGSQEDGARPE
ncbi:MAG: hypothetical protein Q9O74_02720 [Planctomycetota bacterium]|nr:hypothetical protein [Planctomycetota bacterium]